MTEKRKREPIRTPTLALITQALNEAAGDAVEVHRIANLPLVVWKDGNVVLVSPDSIPALRASNKSGKKL